MLHHDQPGDWHHAGSAQPGMGIETSFTGRDQGIRAAPCAEAGGSHCHNGNRCGACRRRGHILVAARRHSIHNRRQRCRQCRGKQQQEEARQGKGCRACGAWQLSAHGFECLQRCIRGSRVGAGPMGEAERGEAAPRVRVSFWCCNQHETVPSFASDAAVPETWDCPRCGFPAGQDQEHPPAPPHAEPYKTHLAYVKERRNDTDGAAILAEALDRLRRGA